MKNHYEILFISLIVYSCSSSASYEDLQAFSQRYDVYNIESKDLNVENLPNGFRLITLGDQKDSKRATSNTLLNKANDYIFIEGVVDFDDSKMETIDSVIKGYQKIDRKLYDIMFYNGLIVTRFLGKNERYFSSLDLRYDTIRQPFLLRSNEDCKFLYIGQ